MGGAPAAHGAKKREVRNAGITIDSQLMIGGTNACAGNGLQFNTDNGTCGPRQVWRGARRGGRK